ncbi:lytic transglycosylase [Prosthecomicrobium hirschii]|uniref:Lytic transglycosylase n=2 Tax=Prosthecodimorpha hirschii TaxID=665126 RepID=A0A0P6W646_9HYPH|nr:lytic transglycosylase [Prosthecomicrobium hirschii]
MPMIARKWAAAGVALGLMAASPAFAGPECQNGQDFPRWLDGVRREAAAAGISQATIQAALGPVQFDPGIVKRDRGQGVFQQTFLQFAGRMVSADRMSRGGALLKSQAALLGRIEQKFGVPAPVLVAFWGLETDFGSDKGKYPIFTSLATLAYDCRRPDFFRPELIDALRIVEKGDLTPGQMVGDWAGEAGHMMMTPTDYDRSGVDFDGDGRRDVINSVPDALASGASLLVHFGWKRGEPWLQEVRVPADLPWDQADLAIRHPRAQWARWGVAAAHGSLPADGQPASLLLPMGRNGPAFLAYPNFQAFLGWNKAFVYATTAAYYATRLSGAPPVSPGNGPVTPLTTEQVRELQGLLVRRGFSREQPDGRIGNATRSAVKQAQMRYGLPADSYPTADLIERLRGG